MCEESEVTHEVQSRVSRCYYRILTFSMIYYKPDVQQHGIYLVLKTTK